MSETPEMPAAGGQDPPSSTEKNPDDGSTGGESMTGAQASCLKTLCEEAGALFESDPGKADASKKIDALRNKTGRGHAH